MKSKWKHFTSSFKNSPAIQRRPQPEQLPAYLGIDFSHEWYKKFKNTAHQWVPDTELKAAQAEIDRLDQQYWLAAIQVVSQDILSITDIDFSGVK